MPKYIEKFLDWTTGKALDLNVKLDPPMLEDKEFLNEIKIGLNIPKGTSGKALLDFIDENPTSVFTKYAAKFEKVKLLPNGIRDPRAYVDIEELKKFKNSIEEFAKKAIQSADIEKFAQKAKVVKSVNILTNVGLSSFLLAYCLPKVQYAFREWFTGSKLEPGIVDDK